MCSRVRPNDSRISCGRLARACVTLRFTARHRRVAGPGTSPRRACRLDARVRPLWPPDLLDSSGSSQQSPEQANLANMIAFMKPEKRQLVAYRHCCRRRLAQPIGGHLSETVDHDRLRVRERSTELAQPKGMVTVKVGHAALIWVARSKVRRPGRRYTQERMNAIAAPEKMAYEPVHAVAALWWQVEGLRIAYAIEITLERPMCKAVDDDERCHAGAFPKKRCSLQRPDNRRISCSPQASARTNERFPCLATRCTAPSGLLASSACRLHGRVRQLPGQSRVG